MQLTNLTLGGGFGRRLPFTLDYVDLGARIAKAMSPAPVKTIWTPRERHPARLLPCRRRCRGHAGALDAGGAPLAVHSNYAGGGDGEVGVHAVRDRREGSATSKTAEHPIRTGPWRSVLNSQHGFFKESFIDEMAHAAGKDPFEFRRGLLGEQPRFKAALEKAAAMSGWGTPLPPGEGRGIAICRELRLDRAPRSRTSRCRPTGMLKVLNVYAAVDCGDVVNLDSATAQVEGGIIFALSAALARRDHHRRGRVVETQLPRLPDDPHRRRAEGRPRSSSAPMRRSAGSASRACRRLRRR